jgi:ADP-ribose pyrophosphatase
MQKLGEFFMSPGILDERMHVYLAEGLVPGPTALESGEQITSRLTTPDEALTMIDRGEIADAKTLAALLMYRRQL